MNICDFLAKHTWLDDIDSADFRLHNGYIIPNGTARWYVSGVLGKFPKQREAEKYTLVWEERLIHPIIAMQVTVGLLDEVVDDLFELMGDIVNEANKVHSAIISWDPEVC
jgi:hypothetical protein